MDQGKFYKIKKKGRKAIFFTLLLNIYIINNKIYNTQKN